jgi:hypothetical protein
MDKKYLHRVIDRIVYETRIDFNERTIYAPFNDTPWDNLYAQYFIKEFNDHCEDVYGLTDDEMRYVRYKYRDIIEEKINQ